jgi:hypothetical protein
MVSFWGDHWIGPSLLADAFPALFSHVHRTHISVRDAWSDDTWTLVLPQRLTTGASRGYAAYPQLGTVAGLPSLPLCKLI